MAEKQLVLVVECTAALCPHWWTIVSDYLEKVIRKFCGNEAKGGASSIVELALVQFNAHGSNSSCLVQRSCWARNADYFLEWLSCMHFSGGGFCDAAIAEGLAEVLMTCPPPNGTQTQPAVVLRRHCILVAASNPYPLPTVYWPPNKSEMQSESCLSDAVAVAKSFPQSCVSLSVMCPKQLPKLKAIYNAGKRNPSTTAPSIDVGKNPNYLILISEDFMEACAALSPSIITNSPSNQSPSNIEVTSVYPISEPPPTSVSPVNESMLTRLPVFWGNIPLATVKVEPSTVSATAQSSPGGKVIHMSNMIVGSGPAPLAGTAQVAQHAGTMMAVPGMSQQVQGIQSVGVNNMGTNVGLSQQTLSAQQPGRPKYIKIWEGELSGERRSQIIMITRLEAYRSSSSAESLADDWPSSLQIYRLISQDHINRIKQYYRKCEFIVFRALGQHGIFGQMQDMKLCAVIRLPSQMLLLSTTDKLFCLNGMLLPPDMLVFKTGILSQQLSQPGTSQGAGGRMQSVGVGQGQVSSPGPKPKPELS